MRKKFQLWIFVIILSFLSFSCGSSSDNNDGFSLQQCQNVCQRAFSTCQVDALYTQWSTSPFYYKSSCESRCYKISLDWQEEYSPSERAAIEQSVKCLNEISCEKLKENSATKYSCYVSL